MSELGTSTRIVPKIALLALAVVGAGLTLSIFFGDARATTCDYTACDPAWAMSVLTIAGAVFAALLLAGAGWTISTRQSKNLIAPSVTLGAVAVACFVSVVIYTGAGPVNP